MSSFLNVPFLPLSDYQDFLLRNRDYIRTLHYALPGMEDLSSWQSMGDISFKQLCLGLIKFPGQRKFVLLDSNSCQSGLLLYKHNFNDLVKKLFFLTRYNLVDGIVFNDFNLVQKISDKCPGVAAKLEAVPGYAYGLDSFAKIDQLLSYISETSFKKPTQITLDVNINRDLDSFDCLLNKLKTSLPLLGVEVVANEGCLYHCPLAETKKTESVMGKISPTGHGGKPICARSCAAILSGKMHAVLQSPFIRPENINNYLCYVDSIKICGVDLGHKFLMNCINAYIAGSYSGNLLDLLSNVNWLADKLFIDNRRIADNFFEIRSQCNRECLSCGFCENLFNMISRLNSEPRQGFSLKTYEN